MVISIPITSEEAWVITFGHAEGLQSRREHLGNHDVDKSIGYFGGPGGRHEMSFTLRKPGQADGMSFSSLGVGLNSYWCLDCM